MEALSNLICIALWAFLLLLLARVIVGWLEYLGAIRQPASGPLRSGYELLHDVTEPVLKPLRRIIPPAGMMDLSPLAAFAILTVLQLAFC
jgi:YggT family protein